MLYVWTLTIGLALQTPPAVPPPAEIAWPDDRPFTRLFHNLAHDFRALPSRTTGLMLAAGGGGALVVHPFDDNVAGWVETVGDSSYTQLGNVLGDAWTQAGGAVATYAIGKMMKRPEVAHVGSDLIRAQALNGVITTTIKIAVNRTRPSGGHRAFPSGHTSAAFASAAVLHGHYGWEAGLAGYATAGFISWTRMRDKAHWLSDGVFGATVGIITGYTVTAGHRDRAWGLVPVKTEGGIAIYFVR